MSPVEDADGFAAEDEDQGDATSDGPATASVIASKRVLDDDVDDDDDDGDALTSLGVSEAFVKRRRLGMRDDYDDDDRESRVDGDDDAGRTGDEGGGAARSGDADDHGESGEGSRKCGDHPRAEADDAATAAAVVVLPFSSYRIVTPSSLDGSFELMRFRPSKDRTIALEECDGNHPPSSPSTAPPNGGIFSLTTIEAVKAALEICGDRGRNDHSLDVDSIVRAFEGGMLEVVVLRRATTPPDHRGSSSDGVGDVGVVSVRLALDGPRAGGDGIGESPGGGGISSCGRSGGRCGGRSSTTSPDRCRRRTASIDDNGGWAGGGRTTTLVASSPRGWCTASSTTFVIRGSSTTSSTTGSGRRTGGRVRVSTSPAWFQTCVRIRPPPCVGCWSENGGSSTPTTTTTTTPATSGSCAGSF